MTRAAAPPILLQIRSPESISSQLVALRTLKNEVIGHDQRKETFVAGGVIPVLSQVLAAHRPGKADPNGSTLGHSRPYHPSEEAEACLQAILIVGSLAQGILTSTDVRGTSKC